MLQSKQAYRHVLFNGGYQSLIIRMALLTLICDGYISWAQSAGAGEFFEQEYEFYMMCLRLVIGMKVLDRYCDFDLFYCRESRFA